MTKKKRITLQLEESTLDAIDDYIGANRGRFPYRLTRSSVIEYVVTHYLIDPLEFERWYEAQK
jgi:hypothetical protein